MDKFTQNLTEGMRRFAMASVGAVSVTIEKSKELFDHLATRGEAAAAESQAACGDFHKKMSAQFDAFSKKLKTDYENASFDSLLKKCGALTPEQKKALIARMTAEEQAEQPEATDETEAASADEQAQPAADEPADEVEAEVEAAASDEFESEANAAAETTDAVEQTQPDAAAESQPIEQAQSAADKADETH